MRLIFEIIRYNLPIYVYVFLVVFSPLAFPPKPYISCFPICYALPKISLSVRHTLSKETYIRRVLFLQRDILYGHFDLHYSLNIQNFLITIQ